MQKLIDYINKKLIKYIWGSQKAYRQVNKRRIVRFKKVIIKSNETTAKRFLAPGRFNKLRKRSSGGSMAKFS